MADSIAQPLIVEPAEVASAGRASSPPREEAFEAATHGEHNQKHLLLPAVASNIRGRSNTLVAILASEVDERPQRRDMQSPLSFLYRLFKSLPMQVLMILLTFVDVSFLLYEFSTGDVHLAVVTLCTSLMFFLEIVILWSYEGTGHYFRNDRRWCIAEVLIVSVSFAIEYAEYIVEALVPANDFAGDLRYLRAVRFLRVLIIWKTRYRNFTAALRRLVSADRRRYQKDGYDLDLTYVHPKVIAMSWPSSRSESLYRNQIDTVAAFLDEKHEGHYRVYNLCSERAYDESKFHFQCARYRVDDHSPPELLVMLHFAQDVHRFIQRDPRRNVAVIHCKGGKGRTGTMVCTYLLYAGIKKTADTALAHFGLNRTSENAKSFQGVESPAQERYVHYFERLLKLPDPERPRTVRVRFTQFVLHNVPFAWWSSGLDRLWFAMIAFPSTKRECIYVSNPTVTFNAQLPPDPFRKRKVKLGSKGAGSPSDSRKVSVSPRGADLDEEPQQENVYSDDEASFRSPRQVEGGDATQLLFSESAVGGVDTALLPCQPHSANMTVYVGRDMDDPMDYAEFCARHMGAAGDASGKLRGASGMTSSRFLSAGGANRNHHNALSSRTFRSDDPSSANGGGGKPTTRWGALDKTLCVSVAFDVQQMPPFQDDLNLRFFYNQDDPNTLQCSLQTFFHTAFEERCTMTLDKGHLDGPHKEVHKEKKFPKHIQLHMTWEEDAAVAVGDGVEGKVPAFVPLRDDAEGEGDK